jgi:hypothetical protein
LLLAGILLLLAGLLPAALLLPWLLTGRLVLLARVLVLVAHSGSPMVERVRDNLHRRQWLHRNDSSMTIILCRRFVAAVSLVERI